MLSAARPDSAPDSGQAYSGAAPQPELDGFRSNRTYLGADHRRNERRTWIVVAICAVTCAAQLTGGTLFHSMALSASGLHMAAHVAVLLTAAGAYWLARRLAGDARFAFGAGKVGYLAGFANAVVLVITAVTIAVESVARLFHPEAVDYGAAIPLAAAGLVVTVLCVWLLRPTRGAHAHHDHDGDLNLSAAHLHLTADAIISVLTMAGLAAGGALGWSFADPLMGLAGAGLVAQFAYTLIRRAGAALLDINPSPVLTEEIRTRLEAAGARVLDLHLWRLGPGHHAAVAVVTADAPAPVETYRARLEDIPGLSHLTIEVRGAGAHGHIC
jgi:cation diffusion facilitator family transporter